MQLVLKQSAVTGGVTLLVLYCVAGRQAEEATGSVGARRQARDRPRVSPIRIANARTAAPHGAAVLRSAGRERRLSRRGENRRARG